MKLNVSRNWTNVVVSEIGKKYLESQCKKLNFRSRNTETQNRERETIIYNSMLYFYICVKAELKKAFRLIHKMERLLLQNTVEKRFFGKDAVIVKQ